ncbi:MAG: hypothetical protein HRF49_07625 [bacterium]|jgi:hypothetical protein
MTSYALCRLSRVKKLLNITASTWDTHLKQLCIEASQAFESETGRVFDKQTYTSERYTLDDEARRLYLKHWPVVSVTSLYFSDTLIAATDYEIIDSRYLLYPKAGATGTSTLRGTFPAGDSEIKVTYVAGYTTTGWDTASLPLASGETFAVPEDIEYAIAEYVAVLFKRSLDGDARIGITSRNRGSESEGYEKYVNDYPDVFNRAVAKYRGNWI